MKKTIGAVKRPILIEYEGKLKYIDASELDRYKGCKIIKESTRIIIK